MSKEVCILRGELFEIWTTEAAIRDHEKACRIRDEALEREHPIECPAGHHRRFWNKWVMDPKIVGLSDAEFREFVLRLPVFRTRRAAVTKADREYIFDRDGHACVVCASTSHIQIDHIVPHSRGGAHDRSNFQTLCRRCNLQKKDKTMDEWLGVDA